MDVCHDGVLDRFTSRLINRTAQRLSPAIREPRQDIEQDLRLHVVRQQHHFDPARGRWSTFAKQVVSHRAICLWREAQSHRSERSPISLQTVVRGADSPIELSQSLTETDALRRQQQSRRDDLELAALRHDVSQVVASLPPDDRWLCFQLRQVSVSELARRLGVPRSTLSDRIRRIAGRFEDAGLRDYL